MLHVRMLSGERLASISLEESGDVKTLKHQLNQQYGLPTRFRQRLFLCGQTVPLDDSLKLESSMELELVLLSLMTAGTQADELVAAAASGSTSEACFPRLQTRSIPRFGVLPRCVKFAM